MTTFFDDVARASLPVAIGLLVLAAVAAVATRHNRAPRTAQQYLEPLCTWCVLASLLHAVAQGAAGELSVGSLAIPVLLCGGAIALRPADDPPVEPAARPHDDPPWAEPVQDPTARPGLWSR